jgi:hypothetical protein
MALSVWEIAPKFYQKSTSENTAVLFIAKSHKNDVVDEKRKSGEKEQVIDYKKMLEDINTDGA